MILFQGKLLVTCINRRSMNKIQLLRQKVGNLRSLSLIEVVTATRNTLPPACGNTVNPHAERMVTTVTVVTEQHLLL